MNDACISFALDDWLANWNNAGAKVMFYQSTIPTYVLFIFNLNKKHG